MAVALYGNNGYKKNVNITVDASQILKPVRAIEGCDQLVSLGLVTGNAVCSGIPPGTLTSSQIVQAAKNPMGLQLGGGAATTFTGGAYTTPSAASLLSTLGITAVGEGKFIRFFWLDAPITADLTLTAGTGVTITTLGSAAAGVIICLFTAVATGVTYNQAEVYITATNVTVGSEAVHMTITKQGVTAIAPA